jgi:hypothetical protein
MVTVYTIALTVACCLAVVLVISSERRSRPVDSSWVTTSTLALLAAASATLSTLAYAISGPNDEYLLPLVIGDVTQPLSVGLLAACVRRASGTPHNQTWAVYFLLLSLGVGAVTVWVSPAWGTDVKLVALAAFSVIGAVACWRGRARLAPLGAALVGGPLLVYAAYCVARLISLRLSAPVDPLVLTVFGRGMATIIAAATVAVIALGVILILRGSQGDTRSTLVSDQELKNWVEALLVSNTSVTAIGVSVPDILLHRIAFGRPWAMSVLAAAMRATVESVPASSIVAQVTPEAFVALRFGDGDGNIDIDVTRARMREVYAESIPPAPPTRPPELVVEALLLSTSADVRRFARNSRARTRAASALRKG